MYIPKSIINIIIVVVVFVVLLVISSLILRHHDKKKVKKWVEDINHCESCGSTKKDLGGFQIDRFNTKVYDEVKHEISDYDSCRPTFYCKSCSNYSGSKSMYNITLLERCSNCNSSYLGHTYYISKINSNSIYIKSTCNCKEGEVMIKLDKKD